MANYYATARSNYVRVRDVDAFRAWAESRGLEVMEGKPTEGAASFMLAPSSWDGAGWPSAVYDDDAGDWIDIDIYAEAAEHLVDDDVFVFMEAGAEKLRYVVGVAVAVNARGESASVSLNDIYAQAAALGAVRSDASY
jgi:hypothetical protein